MSISSTELNDRQSDAVDEAILEGLGVLGSAIPIDANNVILGCSKLLYAGLPQGNKWYEDCILEFCQAEKQRLGVPIIKKTTKVVKDVLKHMGFRDATSFHDDSVSTGKQFWYVINGKVGRSDWMNRLYMQVTDYKTLYEKEGTALNSRLGNNANEPADTNHRVDPNESVAMVSPEITKRKFVEVAADEADDRKPSYLPQIPERFRKTALETIRSCKEVDEFIRLYDFGGLVHDCLQRIAKSQGMLDPEIWAEDWANRLRAGNAEANSLDRDRKLSLELLYTLCNRWKGRNGPMTISEDDIVYKFKNTRVLGILRHCLVMDRAKALCFMMGVGQTQPGIHWFAEQHAEQDKEWLNIMNNEGCLASMNKRYLWLLNLEGLRLYNHPFLRRLTTPVLAPHSRLAQAKVKSSS